MSDAIRRKLAEELRGLGLLELAQSALEGLYSDFDSPLATPKMALVDALWSAAEKDAAGTVDHKNAVLYFRRRVMEGEFDG